MSSEGGECAQPDLGSGHRRRRSRRSSARSLPRQPASEPVRPARASRLGVVLGVTSVMTVPRNSRKSQSYFAVRGKRREGVGWEARRRKKRSALPAPQIRRWIQRPAQPGEPPLSATVGPRSVSLLPDVQQRPCHQQRRSRRTRGIARHPAPGPRRDPHLWTRVRKAIVTVRLSETGSCRMRDQSEQCHSSRRTEYPKGKSGTRAGTADGQHQRAGRERRYEKPGHGCGRLPHQAARGPAVPRRR
jgi:hypothetical protein